jgi:hypothetical protein
MASLRDILGRFRFRGVPGAPGVAGVPADRGREFDAELPLSSRQSRPVLSENSIRASSYILVLVDQPTESIVPTYCASMAVTTSAVV